MQSHNLLLFFIFWKSSQFIYLSIFCEEIFKLKFFKKIHNINKNEIAKKVI